jgi:hypothetical protein
MVESKLLKKLPKRTRDWLISPEFIEQQEEIAKLFGLNDSDLSASFGLEDSKLYSEQTIVAQTLEYCRPFDLGLIVVGDEADLAVDKLALRLGMFHGKKLSEPSKKQLNCLLANLYRFYLRDKALCIRLSLRNDKAIEKRYNPSGINSKALRSFIDALNHLDLLHHIPGHFARVKGYKSQQSRIAADDKLVQLLEDQFGWRSTIVRFHELDELVILKSEKVDKKSRTRIDYQNTDTTNTIRQFLRRYNHYIANQKIMLFGDWNAFPDLIQMRRIFIDGSWEKGGRLLGGEYWQLPKRLRNKIQINGEPTVEVDIQSCHPTMAFATVGIDWYEENNKDIYDRCSLDWQRGVIKKAFNIMLNAKGRSSATRALNRLGPKDLSFDDGHFVGFKGWAKKLVLLVEKTYPELAGIFYAGCGNTFMKMEGDICSQVIQKCMDLDIPVLTIHDSFICPEQQKETVSKLINEAFTDVVGVSCVVK